MTPHQRLFTSIVVGLILGGSAWAQSGSAGSLDALSATAWQQASGEFRALCYQAYAIARVRLDADLKDSSSALPRAIVVDVDETVLDNSPHQAKLLLTNARYPSWWSEWVSKASAEAIPGAVDFLQYAATRGVTTYYITNRSGSEASATIANLRRRGFPGADSVHVIVRGSESGKESRRRAVSTQHRIIMLMGDNLNDFAAVFDRASVAERIQSVDRWKNEFGTRWIVLPNPMYGDWESAIMRYERGLTPDSSHARRMQSLRSFE